MLMLTRCRPASASYDFILIDCPPALNMLTVNGLVAADSVLIPMQCGVNYWLGSIAESFSGAWQRHITVEHSGIEAGVLLGGEGVQLTTNGIDR